MQRAYHLAEIDGEDLSLTWQYEGYVHADRATQIEFSIDTEASHSFEQLRCQAFDLRADPHREHPIAPLLLGTDGLSKKVAIPFLEPLDKNGQFNIVLTFLLPGCIRNRKEYYASTLSFAQTRIESVIVHLVFHHLPPDWVRVYDCDHRGKTTLANSLRPFRNDGLTCEYLDLRTNVPGQRTRVFLFQRNVPPPLLDSEDDRTRRLGRTQFALKDL